MNKEEILKASREENKNRDLVDLEITARAGNIAGRVGGSVACVISLIASVVADTVLYSPWIIYFSIIGTNALVKFIKLKRKTELVLALLYLFFAVLGLVMLITRLLEMRYERGI